MKRIGDNVGEMMTQPPGWLCKPNFRKVIKVPTQRRRRKGNVSIVGRKDTSRKIVGLKVEGAKGRDPRGGRKVASASDSRVYKYITQ